MLTWVDLDKIDHFSWGVTNKKCRSACLSEVSQDTWDILQMLCGEEVGSTFYIFNCKTSLKQHSEIKTNSFFIAAGNPSLHRRAEHGARAGCVCLLANTKAPARAPGGVFGSLEEGYPRCGYPPGLAKFSTEIMLHLKKTRNSK